MIYGSICSGHCAATQAWKPLGFEPAFFAEIEAFPSGVLAHRFRAGRPRHPIDPEAMGKERKRWESNNRELERMAERGEFGNGPPNLGDFTRIDAAEFPDLQWLVGGPPCFPAGTMIATADGFRPIEEIQIGDMVLTHTGQFKRVERVGSKVAPTVRVIGQGHAGFVTTANHPFLSRRKWSQNTRRNGKYVLFRGATDPVWTPASEMEGQWWACVADWPEMDVPLVSAVGNESRTFALCDDLFRLAGAYLGDGWTRSNERRGAVLLGLSPQKLEALRPTLERLGSYHVSQERTTLRVTIGSRALARWLSTHFGSGSSGKRLPMWSLGMRSEWRAALLQGYRETDGTPAARGAWRANTVSPALALQVRMLANSLGYASSVTFVKTADTCVIEGRTVNQRDYHTVSVSPSARSSFYDAGFRWQLVRKVAQTGREERVFDMTVADDHSYIADGIAVHNCQSFSVAGLRGGLDDHRGDLTLAYVRLIHGFAASRSFRGAIYENVPGLLSDKSNAFGCFLGALLGHDAPIASPLKRGRWTDVGVASGPAGRLAWGILDARYFTLAQRRRRVFVVFCPHHGPDPVQILFDPKGVPGAFAPGAGPGQDVAFTLAGGARAGGGYSLDDVPVVAGTLGSAGKSQCTGTLQDATSSLLIPQAFPPELSPTLKGEGFDASEDGTGRAALVPMAFGGNNCSGPIDLATARTASHTASGRQDFESETFIVEPVAYAAAGHGAYAAAGTLRAEGGDCGLGSENIICEPISFNARQDPDCQTGLTGLTGLTGPLDTDGYTHAIAFDTTQITNSANRSNPQSGDPCHPITATGHAPAIAFSVRGRDGEAHIEAEPEDVSPALRTGSGGSDKGFVATIGQGVRWAVRRLLPVETERLQGTCDDFTKIPWRGKSAEDCPDGPRYRVIGNSMAVPVLAWLGRKILEAENARP